MKIFYILLIVLSLSLSETYRVRRQVEESIPDETDLPDIGEESVVDPTEEEPAVIPKEQETAIKPTEEEAADDSNVEETAVDPTGEETAVDPTGEETAVDPTGEGTAVEPAEGETVVEPTEEETAVEPTEGPKDVEIRSSQPANQPALAIEGPCSEFNGSCVPYYTCQIGGTVTDLKAGTLTTKNLVFERHSGCSQKYFDVCCRDQYEEGAAPVEEFPPASGCGQRNARGVGAFISDLPSIHPQFGEFPWMSAILRREGASVKRYMCGGSLIEPNVVLTAAHCVFEHAAKNIIVRAGEWDSQFRSEPMRDQDVSALEIIFHPEFNPKSLANDFALVILESPFQLSTAVSTICLPDANDVFNDQTCFASGWGQDKFGVKAVTRNILKRLDLKVVDSASCQEALRKTRLGNFFELHNSFICAGGEPDIDTCRGDGGSPLVCAKTDSLGSESYYQAGIVAGGVGCGKENVPGLYADVRKALPWINTQKAPFV